MKLRFSLILVFACVLTLAMVLEAVAQQNLPNVRVSPQAKVVQSVGFAKVEIDYSRPGVKGREIWGYISAFLDQILTKGQ